MTTSSQKVQPRLWRGLEAIPGLTASAYEWRGRLGADYEWAKQFLRASGGKATSYPCPKRPQCGCAHAVVIHSKDDIVAVCRCSPRRCESVKLIGMDIVLYELNRRALGNAVASALGAKAEEASCGGLYMTWQVGTYPARPGTDLPLLMTIQSDQDEFKSAVRGLLAHREGPFVLMAPTDSHWRREYESDMVRRQARFLPLNDLLIWDGKLTATHALAEALGGYLEKVLPPARDLYVLEKLGKTWRVVFQGEEKTVQHSKGMDYIAELLKNPGQELHSSQLRLIVSGPAAVDENGGAEIMSFEDARDDGEPQSAGRKLVHVDAKSDEQAIKEYRERLADIESELKEAERFNDTGRIESLKREFNILTQEASGAKGLGGRLRTTGEPAEQARQAVSRAIHRVLGMLEKEHPAFCQHLRNSLKIGEYLNYRPEQTIKWTS